MEILQFLLSLFSSENEKLTPIIEHLKANSFNILQSIKTIKPELIAPILNDLVFKNNTTPTSFDEGVEVSFGVKPIENFADQTIVDCLNQLCVN
jgi:hypothetical protein